MKVCQDWVRLICLSEGRQDDDALEDLWIGNYQPGLKEPASMNLEDRLGDTLCSWGHKEAGCMVASLGVEAGGF